MVEPLPDAIVDALRRLNLPGAHEGERLTGGVSSDIWRVDFPAGSICVKRALPKLRVAADWHAPVERNIYEARWMRHAGGFAPGLLGQDEAAGVLAMAWLPPERYPLWKNQLRDGNADPAFAASVGAALVSIHAEAAARPEIADEFPTGRIFYDIRLEPYLAATARAHPDLADRLLGLIAVTQANKKTLVHGDVSPKNILAGPHGPVFLDAECAWWGDPAFDLAFCLNHLLLKCLWTPGARDQFLDCFDALAGAYFQGVAWEEPDNLEQRAAALLPGLSLARVDGKSPAEYITGDAQKDQVRRVARALLADPPDRLAAIRDAWKRETDA
ncbi:MAG: aminoglycoside phosphotransferase family protein [Acetobacteraceae bacterium]|nr:aminoglycoside phosphotransferase family protein [Acetobacteraceae bacterium]